MNLLTLRPRRIKMITIKILGPYPSCTPCDLAEKECKKAAGKFPGQFEIKHLAMMTAEFGMYKDMVPPIILIGNDLLSTGKVVSAADIEIFLTRNGNQF